MIAYFKNSVYRPPLAHRLLPRERLYKELDALCDKRLILINAPAGTGKSTLVASYMMDRNKTYIWHTFSNGGLVSSEFYSDFCASCQDQHALDSSDFPKYNGHHTCSIDFVLEKLVHKLNERAQKPITIVFDEVNELEDPTKFETILRAIVSALPDRAQLYIISNNAVSGPCSIQSMQYHTIPLAPETLLFSESELNYLIKKYQPNQRDRGAYAKTIMSVSLGLAEHIVALLDLHPRELKTHQLGSDLSLVNAYEKILNAYDEQSQFLLLQLSLFPWFTEAMLQELAEPPIGKYFLRKLSRKSNLLLRSEVDNQLRYQFHTSFHRVLDTKFRSRVSPADQLEIVLKAADIMIQHSVIEHAARLFIRYFQWRQLIHLISTNGCTLYTSGRKLTLRNWLRKIPADISERDPQCQYWLGVTNKPEDTNNSRICFENAYALYKGMKLYSELFKCWHHVVDGYFSTWEKLDELDYWIGEFEHIEKYLSLIETPLVVSDVQFSFFRALMWRQPQHPLLPTYLAKLEHTLVTSKDLNQKSQYANVLVMYYLWWRGDTKASEKLVDIVKPIAHDASHDVTAQLQAILVITIHHGFSHADQACQQFAQQGLLLSRQHGIGIFNFELVLYWIQSSLSCGNLRRSRRLLSTLFKNTLQTTPYHNAYSHFAYSWSAICDENPNVALEHAVLAYEQAKMVRSPVLLVKIHLTMAQIYIDLANFVAASNHIDQAFLLCTDTSCKYLYYLCLIANSQHRLLKPNGTGRTESLENAINFGKRMGFMSFPWLTWRKPRQQQWFIAAFERNIQVDYLSRLMHHSKLYFDQPPIHLANWPWDVRIYSLGDFRIEWGKYASGATKKFRRQSLQVLKAIIALGGNHVSLELLYDSLWPASTIADPFARLYSLVNDINQRVQSRNLLDLQDKSVSINARICWLDTWVFLQLVQESNQYNEAPGDRYITLSDQAINLYNGDFLAHERDCFWAVAAREKYKQAYVSLIVGLGTRWEKIEAWSVALEYYRKGLQIDPLSEPLYRASMRCCHHLKRHSEAHSIYQSCCKALTNTLGARPSPDTVSLYHQLTHTKFEIQGPSLGPIE